MKRFFNCIQCILPGMLGMGSAWGTEYVICESLDNHRSYCDIGDIRQARIEFSRQLSRASCEYGRSWGLDRQGVWVDYGCRAEFAVRYPWNIGDDYDRDRDHDRRRDWTVPDRGWREDDRDRNAQGRDGAHNEHWNRKVPDERCPAGFEPGNHRCSDAERRKGCKDMRMPGGTTCNSRGWGGR